MSGRVCKDCGIYKDADQFHRDPRGYNGLVARCKPCKQQYIRDLCAANPEYATRRREMRRRISRKRTDSGKQATYARAHPRRRPSRTPEQKAAYKAKRRARELAAPGTASPAQVAARVAYYGGTCWMCRERPYEHIDHVIPLARGGSNWPSNLRPSCATCNIAKGTEFYERPTAGRY